MPLAALPVITDPVIIDGYTQPGASANTLATGDNAVILIDIRGASDHVGDNAIDLNASNSTVRGLAIGGFASVTDDADPDTSGGHAITTETGTTNTTITGNFLGLNAAGDTADGNGGGIFLVGASNTIGGLTPADRNVISASLAFGLIAGTANNTVQGNYFGTNAAGTTAIPNVDNSVVLSGTGATGNVIGGTTAAARNVVVATGQGVSLFQFSHNNTVEGNYIGVNATATAILGTGLDLEIVQSTNNTIGGSAAGAGNVIGGSANAGILVSRLIADVVGPDSSGNVILGNDIGISPTGVALPNLVGISIEGTTNNTIGGTAAGQGNVIADNTLSGIAVRATSTSTGAQLTFATGDKIFGNSIFGNGGLGIDLLDGPKGNQSGVTTDDPGDTDTGDNNLQNKPNISAPVSPADKPPSAATSSVAARRREISPSTSTPLTANTPADSAKGKRSSAKPPCQRQRHGQLRPAEFHRRGRRQIRHRDLHRFQRQHQRILQRGVHRRSVPRDQHQRHRRRFVAAGDYSIPTPSSVFRASIRFTLRFLAQASTRSLQQRPCPRSLMRWTSTATRRPGAA